MATPEQLANAAKLAETQDEIKKQLEETLEIRRNLASLDSETTGMYDSQIEASITARNLVQEMTQLETDRLEKIEEQRKATRELRDAQRELVELQGDLNGLTEHALEAKLQDIIQQKILIQQRQGAKDDRQDELDALNKKKKLIKENIDIEKKYGKEVRKNLQEAEEGNERLASAFENLKIKIPGIGDSLSKVFSMRKDAIEFATNLHILGKEMGGISGAFLEFAAEGITEFVKGLSAAGLLLD